MVARTGLASTRSTFQYALCAAFGFVFGAGWSFVSAQGPPPPKNEQEFFRGVARVAGSIFQESEFSWEEKLPWRDPRAEILEEVLSNPELQKALEITDDQLADAGEFQRTYIRMLQEERKRTGASNNLTADEIKRQDAEWMEGIRTRVLMPFQNKAIDQFTVREMFLRIGLERMLESPFIASHLEITDEQLKEAIKIAKEEAKVLAEKIAEEKQKFEERVEELTDKSRENVFSALTPAQRRKLQDALDVK